MMSMYRKVNDSEISVPGTTWDNDYLAFWDYVYDPISNPHPPTLKMAMGLLRDNDKHCTIPGIVFGAGDQYGYNRGYIQKDATGFEFIFKPTADIVSGIKFDMLGNVLINNQVVPPLTNLMLINEYDTISSKWNTALSHMTPDGTKFTGAVAKPSQYGTYMAIDSTYGDLALYFDNTEYFRIYNAGFGQISLKNKGYTFLNVADDSGVPNVLPHGTWDFTYATVLGLSSSGSGVASYLGETLAMQSEEIDYGSGHYNYVAKFYKDGAATLQSTLGVYSTYSQRTMMMSGGDGTKKMEITFANFSGTKQLIIYTDGIEQGRITL